MNIDLRLLQDKNSAFTEFGIKEGDFLLENDVALRVKTGIIYLIVNLVNGKVYVGLSRKTFEKRYKKDWSLTSDSEHLKRAVQKYGKENFVILIMEENRGINILNILETYYILKFRSNEKKYGYNKTSGGNSYNFSPDTLEKMRLSSPLLRTKDEFILLAQEKHGNKFNYSKVEYINTHTNINIICNKHNNIFAQTPGTHLQSKIGCPQCVLEDSSRRYSMPFEEFKCRSIKKYGDQFIYYPETFTRIHGSTKLKHNKCGNIFTLNDAYSHLITKTGCWFCGIELKNKTQKQNNLNHIQNRKLEILKELGWENCQNLTYKQLKQKVYQKRISKINQERLKKDREIWYKNLIKRSKDIHGEITFEYLGITKERKTKLQLKCNQCNNCFLQTIYSHFNLTRGCPHCSRKKQGDKKILSLEEFISRTIDKHKNEFEYCKEEYKNSHTPITIKHKKCGYIFKTTPTIHLKGGCQNCRINNMVERTGIKVSITKNNITQIFPSLRHAERFIEKQTTLKCDRALSKKASRKGDKFSYREYQIEIEKKGGFYPKPNFTT